MFDFVRKHTRIMQFLLFLLIVPSFLLFGIEGYSRFRDKGETVAEVAGHEITQVEWDAAHKRETERVRAANPRIDAKVFDTPQARYNSLERLVNERVLAAAAEKDGLLTGDQRLKRVLQEDPNIAALRLPDGSLDKDKYRQLAAQQGLTPEGLEARMRADMSARQVNAGVVASSFSSPSLADLSLSKFFERREVQVQGFAAAEYAPKVVITDADLEAYFKANQSQFQLPEQLAIEYVVLDLDTVKKSIVLSDADVKTYFEQNQARLNGAEERRASHILIEAPKAAAVEQRQKAKAKAEELLAALKKAPESFAELAKKNSQDAGSASNGGDLDYFKRGAMVKPFEDAAFALKKGEVSAVVESDFGYHIIKLTDIKIPKQRSFEEVRPEIEADLRRQQAQRKFAEFAETFTNLVYEQSDSLKPAVDKLKLELRTAANLTRNGALGGATGVLANPKFLAALFAPDAVEKKRNTEAVEVGANQLVSGRIVQHTPARSLALADVRPQVQARLQAQRGAELARAQGMEKLSAWKLKPDEATWSAAITVSRDQPQGQPPQLVDSALRADAANLPLLVGVDLGVQGYAVVRVNKVVPRATDNPDALKSDRGQYSQVWANAEYGAYYELLKERFKVKIKPPKPSNEAAMTATK